MSSKNQSMAASATLDALEMVFRGGDAFVVGFARGAGVALGVFAVAKKFGYFDALKTITKK